MNECLVSSNDIVRFDDPSEFGPEVGAWIMRAMDEMSDQLASNDQDLASLANHAS